jgi:hypothetical protein
MGEFNEELDDCERIPKCRICLGTAVFAWALDFQCADAQQYELAINIFMTNTQLPW